MYVAKIAGHAYPQAFWSSMDALNYLNAFAFKKGKRCTFKFVPV